jgi:hypothetical protein
VIARFGCQAKRERAVILVQVPQVLTCELQFVYLGSTGIDNEVNRVKTTFFNFKLFLRESCTSSGVVNLRLVCLRRKESLGCNVACCKIKRRLCRISIVNMREAPSALTVGMQKSPTGPAPSQLFDLSINWRCSQWRALGQKVVLCDSYWNESR